MMVCLYLHIVNSTRDIYVKTYVKHTHLTAHFIRQYLTSINMVSHIKCRLICLSLHFQGKYSE